MNIDYTRLGRKILNLKWVTLFFIMLIILISSNYFISYLVEYFSGSEEFLDNKELEGLGIPFKLLLIIFIAPIIETLIFQFAIIELSEKLFKFNIVALILSATLFALSHSFNIYYIITTLFPGLLLAFYYLVLRIKNKSLAFFSVALLHSASNLIVFLDEILLRT